MTSTRSWLDQGGIDIADVMDLKDFAVWVSAVFSKTAGQSGTVAAPLRRGERRYY